MVEEEFNILSGQELINLRLKENRDLPIVGQKEFQPTNSWLEKKQIQSALAERKALLEAQRVEKSNALSSAEWIADAKKARVTKKVGKLWENFGHHADDADWLFPEEALLLLETNSLELLFNEMPISIERGYVTLLNKETGCTLNEYRAYSHLARLGFKLFRHLAEVSVTRYEKEIHLDQHVLNQKRTYGPNVNMDVDADNENDKNDSGNVTASVNNENSDISRVISVENSKAADVIVIGSHAPIIQESDKADEVIQIEPEESLNSSDVLSITSKAPTNKSDAPAAEDIYIDDDDDDVVEIPLSKEVVVVNDLCSSSDDEDNENDDENMSNDSDGGSQVSQVSNSNWKRRSNESDVIDVSETPPPRYAVRTNYVTVNEFLYETLENNSNKSNDYDKDHEVIELSDDENASKQNTLGKEISRFYKEIEIINIDSEPEDHNTVNISSNNDSNSKLSKRKILDLFPNLKNGSVNVIYSPPDNLLPPNVRPSRREYTLVFSTSDIVASNSNRNRNYNTSNSNSHVNVNNNSPMFFVRNRQMHERRREFQGSYNHSSYCYNQNRSRFSDNVNQVWAALPWQTTNPLQITNPLQNQVNRIQEMATGMMQFATSLLSLPFVQQALPNVPSVLDINQSFHQSISRMPSLYQSSNQVYQNQGNAVTDHHQFFGPRFHNYSSNQYGSPAFNQRNNMITYNSSVRQQFHSVPYNYYNKNFVPNYQRQHYNQNSNNIRAVPNEQNNQRFSQPNIATDCNIRDNNYTHANHSQNVGRSLPEGLNNLPNNINQKNQELNASENVRTGNIPPPTGDVTVTSDQSEFGTNKVSDTSNSHNQGQLWNNNTKNQNEPGSSRGKRKSHRDHYRGKRQKRYYIDKLPEYSVFTDDIEVSDSALAASLAANKDDYISFNRNQEAVNNFNGNQNDCIDRMIDINWKDYVVVDDINRYGDGNGSNDFRNRVMDDVSRYVHGNGGSNDFRNRGYPNNRKKRRWYNRNRGSNWRPNYNSPNKRPAVYNEFRNVHNESASTSNETRNVFNDSRNVFDESINATMSDGIEIIEDTMGCSVQSALLSNSERNSFVGVRRRQKRASRAFRRKRREENQREKMEKNRRRIALKRKDKEKLIEVIDIDLDEPSVNIKVEKNSGKQNGIKAEKNVDSNLANKDNNSVCRTLLMKREGLDDDASRNSIFSNSCVSTNSNNSSCIIKSETSPVKQEPAAVKQETSSLAISTSISSVATSTVETVIVTTTETVINVKLENNLAVKTEKTQETAKDSFVNITDNVTNESSNIKVEKTSEVIQTSLKAEKGVEQSEVQVENVNKFQNIVTVDVKMESSASNVEATVNNKNNEKELTISESVEVTPVASSSTGIGKAGQNEKSPDRAGEVFSWAQLKQKSSTPATTVVEEISMSVESEDDDDEEEDDDDEEDSEDEDDDGEQVQPIIRAKDCKSIGTVLSALQIIGTADLTHTTGGRLKISYDVYMPNIQLKKSSRGLPNYRLVIMSFRDDVPSPEEMAELSNRFQDGVPILIGVVSPDSVSFFMASTIRLPTDDGS